MSVAEYCEKFTTWVNWAKSPNRTPTCKVCPDFTPSNFLMGHHARRHRSSSMPFNCEKSDIEIYYCKECNFQTELTLLFKQHVETYHCIKRENDEDSDYIVRNYICDKCNFETHFSIKWLQHSAACLRNEDNSRSSVKASEKTKLTWYRCDQCEHKCKDKYNLKLHKIAKHLDSDEIQWYHCLNCPYKAKLKKCLKSHIYSVHFNEDSINWHKCPMCPYKGKRKSDLKSHLKRRHRPEIKWYQCTMCPYRTQRNFALKRHINSYHSQGQYVKWYECTQCLFKAKQNSSLTRHINMKHLDEKDVKWYECDKCP